jgi:Tfp pilus assembly protein PilF
MRIVRPWAALAAVFCGAMAGCVSVAGRHDGGYEPAATVLSPRATAVSQREPAELPPSETARVCLATADALFKSGNETDAIMLYEKARTCDPSNKVITRRLAVLYDRQGMHQRARDEFEAALQASPKDPDLLNDLGYSCYVRGLLDEAEQRLSEAVAVAPNHKRAWINLGMVLGQKGEYAHSLDAFASAVGRAQAYSNLGFVYASQGKVEEAKKAYRQALALEPNLPHTQAALSRLESGGAPSAGRFSPKLEAILGGDPAKAKGEAEPAKGAVATLERAQPESKFVPAERVPAAAPGK